jgi:hypothetical protein
MPFYPNSFLIPLIHPRLYLQTQRGFIRNPTIQDIRTRTLNSVSATFSANPIPLILIIFPPRLARLHREEVRYLSQELSGYLIHTDNGPPGIIRLFINSQDVLPLGHKSRIGLGICQNGER